jgi:hypothetical protein
MVEPEPAHLSFPWLKMFSVLNHLGFVEKYYTPIKELSCEKKINTENNNYIRFGNLGFYSFFLFFFLISLRNRAFYIFFFTFKSLAQKYLIGG